MSALIVLLPLLSFLICCLFGRRLGNGVLFLTCFNVLISLILSVYNFFLVLDTDSSIYIPYFKWILSDSLDVTWGFYLDSITAVMLVVVTFISSIVHLYSTEYMKEDPHIQRFMSYLSLFTFFMLILVTGDNFLQMFVGWEGVGLASYLLINFWFTRIQANKSAIKAMLLNRIGDFFLLIAMFLIFYVFDTLDYSVVFSLAPLLVNTEVYIFNMLFNTIDLICLCLFLGAMGKSAQLGLHTWLPDAMEGPTPVSALIHAATMVTAGVFLVVRCSFLFELSTSSLNLLCIVGALTAFFGASVGLLQNDLKKIIAYSTCSQLGYMIFACGLSNYNVAIFHLSNHAFFKALLFLGAGSIIHSVADEQDIRRLGGLLNLLPFSYGVGLIGSLALVGFPFFTGFYSKDSLLEVTFSIHTNTGLFCYFLGSFSALFTAFYSTRLLALVFLSNPNSTKHVIFNAREGSYQLKISLITLSVFSILVGFFSNDLFIGFGSNFWQNGIYIAPERYTLPDIEFIPLVYKLLPLVLTVFGILSAFFLYSFNLDFFLSIKLTTLYTTLYTFLLKKWYIDKVYNSFIVTRLTYFSYSYTYKDLDRGVLEFFGPSTITNNFFKVSSLFSSLQKGIFHIYLVFGVLVILVTLVLLFSILFSLILIKFLTFMLLFAIYFSLSI